MFYRHEDLQEGYVHQCADAYRYNKEHLKEIARVQKHDASTFMRVGKEIIPIDYCPYCGVKLSEDEETSEFLKLKLD